MQPPAARSADYSTDGPGGKTLVAGRVRVVSALGSGVISSGGSSTDAYYSGASGYGMTMDMMVMDVAATANASNSTSRATKTTNSTSRTANAHPLRVQGAQRRQTKESTCTQSDDSGCE